ncbi:TolB family protein [Planctomycetota bacterium]
MMHKSFPRYTDFDPKVPVWCVTHDHPGCIHRFFDTSPISPSGRYVAVFQLPFEDRLPSPGESGNVCIVNLEEGTFQAVSETCGWEPQMGANINWGSSDHELYFNDVDTKEWQPFAWKLDPLTGERERMEGTVYHASPDGRWLISANMTTMRKTQPGYGVCVPKETVRRNVGPADDDGFYLTDTSTGKRRMLASISDLLSQADPPVLIENPELHEIYGFHSKFNPQSDRLMLSLRWFPATCEPQWNMFAKAHGSVRFAWVTMGLDGGPKHCAVGPEEWEKGGHHATWFPDGKRISMNLRIDRDVLRFVQVNADGSELRKMLDILPGSGHPTVHPDSQHLLTDTYTFEETAFGDGTIPLRWVDLRTGQEEAIVRINTQQPCKESVLRIDPHPAWDRTWRYIAFNAFVGGTRRVFIADMKELIS